jgi:hypothetical protein
MNSVPLSTATTKTHGRTELSVGAGVLLPASHPSHGAVRIIMEEDGAMELTD